jgi:hypothetical protein
MAWGSLTSVICPIGRLVVTTGSSKWSALHASSRFLPQCLQQCDEPERSFPRQRRGRSHASRFEDRAIPFDMPSPLALTTPSALPMPCSTSRRLEARDKLPTFSQCVAAEFQRVAAEIALSLAQLTGGKGACRRIARRGLPLTKP